MKLTYDVQDKPKSGQIVVFALQQLLAIKALFSADQITIEGSNLLPDVIEHNHLDESQIKLLEALFAPP